MKVNDWVYVGIKVLAVYFGVVGVVNLLATVIGWVLQFGNWALVRMGAQSLAIPARYDLYSILEPVLYLAVALLLGCNTKMIFKLLHVTWPADLEPAASK